MLCKAEGCDRDSKTTYGYCVMHYKRVKRNGTTETVFNKYETDTPCSHCGEVRKLRKFLCNPCATRQARKGYVERDVAPAGSGTVTTTGYRLMTVDGRREYQHRIVAGAKPGEVVHHDNRNRLDNDDSNLIVLASQSEHMKLHHLERKSDTIKKED